MRPRLELAAFLVILAAIGGNAYLGLHGESRQSRDEKQTCQIQSTGLEAQAELTQVMVAINQFVQPPDPKNPLSRTLPKSPPVPRYYEYSLKSLRYHLPRYEADEKRQPASRRC